MRQIKCRIWDENASAFWTPDKHAYNISITLSGDVSVGYVNGKTVLVDDDDKFVIQQFTGAKDRNGREIYEGDIVKFGMSTDQTNAFPKLRVVEFYEPQLIYKIVEVGGLPAQVDYLYEAVGASTRWCEVVGNIFENPELLKV